MIKNTLIIYNHIKMASIKLIKDFLKQKHTICFKKSIFVVVQYESKIVFTGSVDFKGLV